MSALIKQTALTVTFALIAGSIPFLAAQKTDQLASTAPVGARLIAANSVFVANPKGRSVAGEKANSDPAGISFYEAMKLWNRYHLTPTAADADLIFQISQPGSQLQLNILDPATHAVLGTFTEPVKGGILVSTRQNNLSQSVNALVDDLRRLAFQPSPPAGENGAPSVPTSKGTGPKVFLSDNGGDMDQFTGKKNSYTGGPGQAFNKFYAAVQSSGQYQIMSSPTDVDFVFEMRYTIPQETVTNWVTVDDPRTDADLTKPTTTHQEMQTTTTYHPQVQLVIRNAKTLAVERSFTELITMQNKQPKRDTTFSAVINTLLNDANRQLGRPPVSISVPNPAPEAPVPPQFNAAKIVFIANTAGKGLVGGTPSTDQAYNEFYATLKSWGGYQLSSSVAGADLIFELSSGNGQVHVKIVDPSTQVLLRAFNPGVNIAILKGNAQKNFDQAVATVVEDITRLSGRPASAISVPKNVPDAPIPSQISDARTAFISYAGGVTITGGMGTSDQAYNDFYATMKAWGKYQLVSTPAQADLVLQVSVAGSKLRVAILDTKTQVVLWGINQDIHGVFRDVIPQKDFSDAMTVLVKSIARLAGQPTAAISVPSGGNTAPIPSGILDARKVFLAKPGDTTVNTSKGAPTPLYDQISADMKNWGRYELTTTRADADLIFEPSGSGDVALTIRDAKSRQMLWKFNRPVNFAFLASNANKNYNQAVGLLIADMHRVASRGTQPSQ